MDNDKNILLLILMYLFLRYFWERNLKRKRDNSSKTHPLPYPNICASLFDGNNAATSTIGSSSIHHVQALQIMNTDFDDLDDLEDDDYTSHESNDPTLDSSADSAPNSSTNVDRPNKRAKTSISLDDLALDMQKALHDLVKRNDGPTVEECYEKLKLSELESHDPLFVAAFYIFGVSMNMREAWMTLPAEPEVLKGWLKMTAMSLGVFK